MAFIINSLKVKAVYGRNDSVCGQDFDDRLVTWCVQQFTRHHMKHLSCEVLLDERAMCRLRISCERAKCTLSAACETTLHVDAFTKERNSLRKSLGLSSRSFVQISFTEPWSLLSLIAEYPHFKDSMAEIILCGGCTRIPKIHQQLQERFQCEQLIRFIQMMW